MFSDRLKMFEMKLHVLSYVGRTWKSINRTFLISFLMWTNLKKFQIQIFHLKISFFKNQSEGEFTT